MLRSALAALVLASAAVACGGGGGAVPAVVAGAPAGDVTEVSGGVTATRGGQPRALAVGDVVSGDDVIATGADGRVAIRLRHNLVPWTLGPGKSEQVAGSLAWKAPRSTQTAAGPTGERSGAAGRHAEREAADTAAAVAATDQPTAMLADEAAMAKSTEREMAPASARMAAPPVTPPPPPAPPAAAADAPGGGAQKSGRATDPVLGGELDDLSDLSEGSGNSGGLGLSGAGAGGGGTGEGTVGLGNVGVIGHGSGTGTGAGYGAGPRAAKPAPARAVVRVFGAKGGLDIALVTRLVRSKTTRFTACVKSEAPARAMVKLNIAADGTVTDATVSGVSAAATSCISTWMKATAFPKAKTATTASVMIQAPAPDGP